MALFDDDKKAEALPEGVSSELVSTVKTEIERMKEMAKAVVVHDQESYDSAARVALECARREKRVDVAFADVDEKTKKAKAASDSARSAVLALIRSLKEPFTAAKKIIDDKAEGWRKAENKRLADEAEAKRRVEQKRLDDEKAAQLAELKRIEDAKKAEAAALRKSGDAEAARLANLERIKAAEQAQAIAAVPVIADVQTEVVEAPKGTTHKEHWVAELYDFPLLLKAIAEGKAPIDLVELNQSSANGYARSQKAAMKYDGIVAKDIGSTSHRV